MSLSTLRRDDSTPPDEAPYPVDSAPPAAPPRAAYAVFIVPVLLMLWSARAMWQAYSPAPFSDAWANIQAWSGGPAEGWLRYLFSQHNEHRILFPRLVFLADWQWLQARGVLNSVVIGLTQLAGAGVFIAAARPRRLSGIGLLGLAVAVALMVSLVQWENLFWGFQVAFVGVYAAAAWALYLFCQASDATTGRVRWSTLAGAIALLTLATFSMANGVFAGLVMVFVGLVTRQRLAAVAAAGVATAALLALYLHGYVAPPHHASPALALHHPGQFVTYIAAYLGALWLPGKLPLAALSGLIGGAATAGMLLVLLRRDGRDPARAALFGVAVFVGVSAASTSLGRLNFGVGQALASRYMTPTAYFWAAQALFWALTLAPRGAPWLSVARGASTWTLTLRRGPASWARIGLALVLVGMLLRLVQLQPVGEGQMLGVRERIQVASSAMLGGTDDVEAIRGIHPEPAMVRSLLPFMRARRMSLFADPPVAQVGAPFTRPIAPEGLCRGYFDGLTAAPADPGGVVGPGAWRAMGWGWDLKAKRRISHILMVDGGGRVVGIGLGGVPRKDVTKVVREVNDDMTGWIASMTPGAGGEVIAYGITSTGTACELGRKAWPR